MAPDKEERARKRGKEMRDKAERAAKTTRAILFVAGAAVVAFLAYLGGIVPFIVGHGITFLGVAATAVGGAAVYAGQWLHKNTDEPKEKISAIVIMAIGAAGILFYFGGI